MARRNIVEHYVGDRCLLPELDHFGWDSNATTTRRLAAHVHRRAYEICVIVRGAVDWWVGPEVYRVGKGDLYITGPGEEHGGVDSMMHACDLYFLQVAFPWRRALPGLTAAQTRQLRQGYAALRHRCFPGSPAVGDCFARILREQRNPGPHALVLARAALHELLVTVLRDHDIAAAQRSGRDADKSPPIRAALQWIDQRLAEDHPVERVAAAVSLGVSRFHERFLDEVGFTPNDYRARRRVELAKAMLREGDRPITDIAMRLGFSSSQYFATVFRKLTGMSPRAYRGGGDSGGWSRRASGTSR